MLGIQIHVWYFNQTTAFKKTSGIAHLIYHLKLLHVLITLLASSNISLKTDLIYGNSRKYFEVTRRWL